MSITEAKKPILDNYNRKLQTDIELESLESYEVKQDEATFKLAQYSKDKEDYLELIKALGLEEALDRRRNNV